MVRFTAELSALAAARHGIVTGLELEQAGNTERAIRSAVATGFLVRVHQGVYRVATSSDTFMSRCAAASLRDPDAMVTGVAAGNLWGFRHLFQAVEPYVAVAHDRKVFSRGVIVRHTNVLDPRDWITRQDGIRVATPVRAWFDCAQDVDDERFERLTEWVLDHHAGVPALWAMRRRLAGRGRNGLARVNRVLSQREAWQRPAGSGLELKVLRELERRGVRGLVRQFPIRLRDGVVVHPDGALPGIKWAVEIDHVTWHGGRFDAQRDKGRDRKLGLIGWQVDRVTDDDVRERFTTTIDELLELIDLRRRSLAA